MNRNTDSKRYPWPSIAGSLLLAIAAAMPAARAQALFDAAKVKSHMSGEKSQFLAGAHGQKGVGCAACHDGKTVDDSERALNQKCTSCHGDLSKLAARTEGEINPHKSHLGQVNCTSCHTGHEASVAYCSNCHDFKDMKISHNQGAKPKSQREKLSQYEAVQPTRTETTDILIVGSGAAGFTAALSAVESGVKVVMVEKMAVPGGNSQLAAGGMNAAGTPYQKAKGIKDNAELMYQDTFKGGKNRADPELVRILADRSAESIQWLADRGAVLDHPGRGGGASAARMHRT
ncbi:MAG: FAD-dependent oxidoreductase [Burkholderiaceae bacterium]